MHTVWCVYILGTFVPIDSTKFGHTLCSMQPPIFANNENLTLAMDLCIKYEIFKVSIPFVVL